MLALHSPSGYTHSLILSFIFSRSTSSFRCEGDDDGAAVVHGVCQGRQAPTHLPHDALVQHVQWVWLLHGQDHGVPRVQGLWCGAHGHGPLSHADVVPQVRGNGAGGGRGPEKSCTTCHGSGSVKSEETIDVDIPAGIEDGMQLQIDNLRYVTIEVEPSSQFRRKGTNVYSTTHISLPQAVLGGKIHVPGLYGDMAVKVPAGIYSGQRLKLRDRGFPSVHDYTKGAHILELVVDIPS